MGSVIAYTMHECMEQCHSHEKCRFGTFIPDKSICLLFETCIKLQYNDLCPSCQTSSPKCGRPGECLYRNNQKIYVIDGPKYIPH